MVFEKLNSWPSPLGTRKLLIVSIIMACASYLVMGYFFLLSGDQTNMLASQLSFSGPFLVHQYSQITNLDAYRITQTLDYLFMVSYSLLVFALAVTIARKFDENSSMRKIGFSIAILGFVAAGLDAAENLFILLTLTAPLTFPAWWAVAHSSFALPKWIILVTTIGWALAASVTLRSQKRANLNNN